MNMPRGTGAGQRRRERRASEPGGVEGASRALDPVGIGLTAAGLATDTELDALMDSLAKDAGCMTCGHMDDQHGPDGCMASGCSCMAYESPEAASDDQAFADLIAFGASGSTRLPLSDRDTNWDAGAAVKTLDPAQYADAHFWRDPDGDPKTLAAYKLPFATVSGGTLTAVWSGVTGAAAALQGSRGGVDIPESDVAGVRSRIAAYYSKASDKYDDPSIKVPWETASLEADGFLIDAVAYAGRGDEFAVVGFEPAQEHLDAAVAALVVAAPDAAELVRAALEDLRDRQFVPAVVAPPLIPPAEAGDPFTLEWDAILAPEGKVTDDGRAFAPGSIRWRELPLSLSAMLHTAEGHDGAKVCGRIDTIWRDEAAGLIRAKGVFDDSEYGREIARLVADQTLRGNSVDIAPLQVEIVPRSQYFDADGNWAPQEAPAGQVEPSVEEVLFGDPFDGEPTIALVTEAVIGMSTVCPFPAFAEATIAPASSLVAAASPLVWTITQDGGYHVNRRSLTAGVEVEIHLEIEAETPEEELAEIAAGGSTKEEQLGGSAQGAATAAATTFDATDLAAIEARYGAEAARVVRALSQGDTAIPVRPPADWFSDPGLDALTPLTVTDDGQVYGHAAGWGSCHTGFPDVCVTPPPSETGYAFYHLKEVVTDDGSRVPVGTITLAAPHAKQSLRLADATAHYDHTGSAVADVRVGEDEYGIWIAGAVRPDVTPETLRELRGASLSGDWRDYQGNLELIALLAVNVPGFPIPRVQTRVAAGVPLALVAAGVLDPDRPEEAWLPPAVDADTAAKLAVLADLDLDELNALAAE